MKRLAMMFFVLLAGCGYVPTESKLVGSWQVVLPARAPQRLIFTFQKDHTYSMTLGGVPGALQGTWRLDGNLITTTTAAFAAYGMTNPMPAVKSLNTQSSTITKLSESEMTWSKGPLGGSTKFRRVQPSRVANPPQAENPARVN